MANWKLSDIGVNADVHSRTGSSTKAQAAVGAVRTQQGRNELSDNISVDQGYGVGFVYDPNSARSR